MIEKSVIFGEENSYMNEIQQEKIDTVHDYIDNLVPKQQTKKEKPQQKKLSRSLSQNSQQGQTILELMGNTPLIKLSKIYNKPQVHVYAKQETFNPSGSVKDRAAYYMIKKAEENGKLVLEKRILEPTSGNTGIALAMIGAAKGYQVTLVMPACVSIERRRILEAYGAEVILTPGNEGTDGAIRKAHALFRENPKNYF